MRDLVDCGIDRSGAQVAAGKGAGRSVTVNRAESPLAWLRARGMIDARQFDAGDQLRCDYERASIAPRVTMRWEAVPAARGARGPGRALDPATSQLAAKQRFDAAIESVGSGLSDILWRVVCAGEGIPAAERALGWPTRAGRLVLTLALDRLAAHYRMQ